jgi:polyisoprenoid-binding protein YceI
VQQGSSGSFAITRFDFNVKLQLKRSIPMVRTMAWAICAAGFGCCFLVAPAIAKEYKLTGKNTKIEFLGTKPDGKHKGSFPKLTGTFDAPDDLTKSKITVTIDMDALESDDPKLTGHLKSPDFFET